MYCKNCGHSLAEEQNYCSHCGKMQKSLATTDSFTP
ncbi:zinc-ribbon domain-containing protein, partial [Gallibacterium faecale]